MMLEKIPGGSFTLSWILHYVMGIVFALAYFFIFNNLLRITNNILRGMLYGFIVFLFAQIING